MTTTSVEVKCSKMGLDIAPENFIGAFAGQWGVGVIINMWPELPSGNYDPAGHQVALITLVCIELVAFTLFLWPRREKTDSA